MAALALLAEGAMGDWSAVYLRMSLGASASLAAYRLRRVSVDHGGRALRRRLARQPRGRPALVRASGGLAALGLGAALVVGYADRRVSRLCVRGSGAVQSDSILFRSASNFPGISAGHGIAAVSTAGYCGFLAGPPLIGLCAEAITLPGALGIVVACLAWIAMSARRMSAAAA